MFNEKIDTIIANELAPIHGRDMIKKGSEQLAGPVLTMSGNCTKINLRMYYNFQAHHST